MSSNVARSCFAAAGASAPSCVMAGPITQVPTNMPIATAAMAAMTGSDRNVEALSR